ncbi:MAG: hypothetical protein ABIE42_01500 [Candidatus Eisenbacteria bacterium]
MFARAVARAVLAAVFVLGFVLSGSALASSVDLVDGALTGEPGSRDIQETIWFQGYIADRVSGEPVNATYTVEAEIFDAESGGSSVWGPESHVGTVIAAGWFSIELGDTIGGLPAFDTPPYYLQLTINGEPFTSRLKLASVPSAFAWRGSVVDQQATYENGIKLVGGNVERRVGPTDSRRHWILADDGLSLYDSTTDDVFAELGGGTGGQLSLSRVDNSAACLLSANSTGGELMLWDDTPSVTLWLHGDSGDLEVNGRAGIGTSDPQAKAHIVEPGGTIPALRVQQDDPYAVSTVLIERTAIDASSEGNDLLAINVPALTFTDFQFLQCKEGGNKVFRLDADGNGYCDGSWNGGGADIADLVRVSRSADAVTPGDVMVIDPLSSRAIERSTETRSSLVAGVVSTHPGFVCSHREWDEPAAEGEQEGRTFKLEDMAMEFDEVPLAVAGIVPCKVCDENGPIRPGDLLVTSSLLGHAMRDEHPSVGTVLGKALEPLVAGTGVIEVLVALH